MSFMCAKFSFNISLQQGPSKSLSHDCAGSLTLLSLAHLTAHSRCIRPSGGDFGSISSPLLGLSPMMGFAVGDDGRSPRNLATCDERRLMNEIGIAVHRRDLGGAGFRGTTAAIYRDGGAAAFFRGFGARGALICCCFFIFNETKLRLGAALWPDELRDARAR